MANYQVLFNGEVLAHASVDSVRANLARELGLDERKSKQLFSGRTVVIRSQLEQGEAHAWQERFAELGAICRIKDLETRSEPLGNKDIQERHHAAERTLRDITAAHTECPRCGHMQLDASHCARCGVDLDAAFRQRHKEDMLIERKIRELKNKRERSAPAPEPSAAVGAGAPIRSDERVPKKGKSGVLSWLKRT